jgi:hypothetical protein
MSPRWITKASGEREEFSASKLRDSLRNAGAPPSLIDEIIAHVESELGDDVKTSDIYHHAFTLLRRHRPPAAARYSLRQAVMQLGPSGFPFERFVAEILKAEGYIVQVGGILPGFCVTHEVDILAEKKDQHIFVECKFHNNNGIKSDVKVALYVKARFDDIKKAHELRAEHENRPPRIHEGWLVTNTKLTSQAIEYSTCAGLTLIGWNYPPQGSLQDLIMRTGVHPLTCLSTLEQHTKNELLQNNVVLCRDVEKNKHILRERGMSEEEISKVIEEIGELCVPVT